MKSVFLFILCTLTAGIVLVQGASANPSLVNEKDVKQYYKGLDTCKEEAFKAMTVYHSIVPRTDAIVKESMLRFKNELPTYWGFSNEDPFMAEGVKVGQLQKYIYTDGLMGIQSITVTVEPLEYTQPGLGPAGTSAGQKVTICNVTNVQYVSGAN